MAMGGALPNGFNPLGDFRPLRSIPTLSRSAFGVMQELQRVLPFSLMRPQHRVSTWTCRFNKGNFKRSTNTAVAICSVDISVQRPDLTNLPHCRNRQAHCILLRHTRQPEPLLLLQLPGGL